MDKAPDAFRTISEVADDLDVPQHVLRFWETRFSQIKPMKRSGGRRYYRPDDVDLLRGIRRLLYGEGYTIRGVQRILKEHGVKSVQGLTSDPDTAAPAGSLEERARPASSRREDDSAPASGPAEDAEDEEAGIAVSVRREPLLQPLSGAAPVTREHDAPPSADAIAAAIGSERRKLDEGRLKAALSELVACRRLLDEALKDG